MHHPDHHIFLDAIDRLETVDLTFSAAEDAADLTHTCAPLDYGPASPAGDRYQLWDYDSDGGQPLLTLRPVQILRFAPTGDTFDPGEFIVWDTDWHHPRDWGAYS